ncbi:hypothetical protein SAMN05444285_13113 [Draconibacterium orientale]|uniref:Lipocalin-like domain-containing protein n=1 Tax=Draconibacterium orientale TaxID=1168034 RepID=X5E6X1_9BACT|nr:hypothetical protein [Draconibacterium orientale]AHW62406.1 hypothetical protein FH5T_20960 [Draconibacterium orientale]SET94621.1 hypothetical protein SAMN05444285_13113 [Draconibacterium orientale]
MKTQEQLSNVILAFVFTLLLSACQKNHNEEQADYNGIWEIYFNIPTNTGYSSLRYEIELNNSTYSESFLDYYSASNEYIYNVWEGEVIKTGNKLQFEVTSMKTYNYDPIEKEVLELISETVPTEPHIDRSLTLSWETVLYTMNNGNLEIRADWNEDGDYEDTDEIMIYMPVD